MHPLTAGGAGGRKLGVGAEFLNFKGGLDFRGGLPPSVGVGGG